jgi:hypothetical protein
MVENLISGLFLLGDVGLLGLLVYNSHKPNNRVKPGWREKMAKQGLATTSSQRSRTQVKS